jgi:hypothetical protein
MKKNKIIILFLSTLITLTIFSACTKKDTQNNKDNEDTKIKEQINNNPGIINEQIVDGIVISETILKYENDSSILTTELNNSTNVPIYVENLNIIFYDDDGNEIANLFAYLGSEIGAGDVRVLSSSIDVNLIKSTKVEYILNKKSN